MTGFAIRVGILILGAIYWWGVFSGYYATHGPYTNTNPNTFINPGIGWLFLLVVGEAITKRNIIPKR